MPFLHFFPGRSRPRKHWRVSGLPSSPCCEPCSQPRPVKSKLESLCPPRPPLKILNFLTPSIPRQASAYQLTAIRSFRGRGGAGCISACRPYPYLPPACSSARLGASEALRSHTQHGGGKEGKARAGVGISTRDRRTGGQLGLPKEAGLGLQFSRILTKLTQVKSFPYRLVLLCPNPGESYSSAAVSRGHRFSSLYFSALRLRLQL